jgi:CHAD domain-containing protein
MSTSIAAHAPLSDAWASAGVALLAAARRAAAADEVGTRDARVHRVRKQIKRARAHLRLARASLPDAEYDARAGELRAVGRALAPARDARVVVETLRKLARRAPPELAPALAEAARRQPAGHGVAWPEVSAALDRAIEGASALHPPMKRRRLLRAVARVADRARAHLAEVERDPLATKFHALRRRVKDLLFQMELLADVRRARRRRVHARLDRLATLLGEEHDLTMALAALGVTATPATFAAAADWLLARRAALRARAIRRARRLLTTSRDLTACIAR